GRESLIEFAGHDHFGKFLLSRGASAGTGIDHVQHDARIEAGFDAHDHRFRGCRHGCCGQHVVAQLHRLAGAGALADVKKLADHFEGRLDRLDIGAWSRRHHRDGAFLRAAHAPRHRRVDLHDAAGAERLEDALRHDGAGGGKIDKAFDAFAFDAAGAGRDFKNDVRRRQARHDRLHRIGDFLRRARGYGAERSEIADGFLAGVIDDDFVAGLDQPPRHMRSHIAETDEADVHEATPSHFSPRHARHAGPASGGPKCKLYARHPRLWRQKIKTWMAWTSPAMMSLDGRTQKLRTYFLRMFADGGHRAVAARRTVVAPRRRRIRYRPARRADSDAAQMRVVRQVRGAIDACKGDIGGGELFFQRIGVKPGEGARDLALGFGAAFDALDIGGEARIGCERGVAEDFVGEHAPFAVALNRYENVDPVAAAKRAIGRDRRMGKPDPPRRRARLLL